MQQFYNSIIETEKHIKEIKQRFIQNAVRLGIELWNPIENYPNYEVSTFGRVRSNYKNGKNKILKPVKNKQGYYTLVLGRKSKRYTVHRLVAHAFVANLNRKDCVDHPDNNPLNNNVSNLRWVTRSENNQNMSMHKNNTSGFNGITYDKHRNKWMAQIKINRKNKFLGRFSNIEDAIKARQKASKEIFGEFRNKCEQ